ncbi:MAG: transposase [Thermodesulfobacteriota bacterium]
MLFTGYLEGFQSERSIAWHCSDRMSLREFLGYQIHEKTPDHSSFTIWRQRLPLEMPGSSGPAYSPLSAGQKSLQAQRGQSSSSARR